MKNFIYSTLTLSKRIMLYDHKILEWSVRILITLNIILPAFPYSEHFYPLDVLILTTIGFWLYIGKLKLLSLLPLLFSLYISYQHFGRPSF